MKNWNFQLDKQSATPLYVQLYQQLKADITEGRMQYAEKLPSKRKLADYLAISRNTVETAYEQLLAEGYIEAKARQGFFVLFKAEQFFIHQRMTLDIIQAKTVKTCRYDLNPNQIDTALFPFARYRKILKSLIQPNNNILLNMGERQGETILREQIRQYLYTSRGVSCNIEQIVLAAGVESCVSQLILLFAQLYPTKPFHYAMEQYGYPIVERLLHLFGKTILKLPLFSADRQNHHEPRMDFSLLLNSSVNVLYLTPSYQYPYGSILSINDRHQVLEWAHQQENRYIIEDDYNSEFRYKGRPIPSLQHLDSSLYTTNKVIYLGSFSKLFMPSLRMTFMVLPQALVPVYQRTCGVLNSTVPRILQHALAHFMQSGEFEKHIHKMRTNYRKKMELLCQLLQPYSRQIRYYGEHSGFYLLLDLYRESRTIEQLQALAIKCGIQLYPVQQDNTDKKYFSLGFGNLSLSELAEAVRLLLQAWGYQQDSIKRCQYMAH